MSEQPDKPEDSGAGGLLYDWDLYKGSRSDRRMLKFALENGFDVPDELKANVVEKLSDAIHEAKTVRDVTSIGGVVVSMVNANARLKAIGEPDRYIIDSDDAEADTLAAIDRRIAQARPGANGNGSVSGNGQNGHSTG